MTTEPLTWPIESKPVAEHVSTLQPGPAAPPTPRPWLAIIAGATGALSALSILLALIILT